MSGDGNGITTKYGYNQLDELSSFNNGSYTYSYNGDGLRMSKGHSLANTQYSWDIAEGLPLLLQDNAGSYIYGPGGMLIEQIQNGTTPYYYHADQLGSIRALTNQAGSVVNTYSYDAYGNTTSSTGTVYNPFKYAGEYQDQESGLYYLRARYYDPSTQQFLTVDPLVGWTEQGYAYVSGSPTNLTDPAGLCSWIPNPWDPNSCMVLGAQTEAGHWVIGGGVAAAAIVTGGFVCLAGGCEAAAGVLGIDAVAAPNSSEVANELAPATESAIVDAEEGETCPTYLIGHWKYDPLKGPDTPQEPEFYTGNYANKLNFRILNLPPGQWTWAKNVRFLQEGLSNGGLRVVTPFTRLGSVFEDEQQWLYEQGAHFNNWIYTR